MFPTGFSFQQSIVALTGFGNQTASVKTQIETIYFGIVYSVIESNVNYVLQGNIAAADKIKLAQAAQWAIPVIKQEMFKTTTWFKPVKTQTQVKQQVLALFTKTPETSNDLWTEKYRPRTKSQLLANDTIVTQIEVWLKNWPKTKYRACVLVGPPGTGKTSCIQAICNDLHFEIHEFNASMTRTKSELEDKLNGILNDDTTRHLVQPAMSVNKNKKAVIVMEEIDGMSGKRDRGGGTFLKELIEHSNFPVFMTANKFARNMKWVLKHKDCLVINWPKLSPQLVMNKMKDVLKSEKLNGKLFSDFEYWKPILMSGDIRQLITNIQWMSHTVSVKAKPLTPMMNTVLSSTGKYSERINTEQDAIATADWTLFEVIEKMFDVSAVSLESRMNIAHFTEFEALRYMMRNMCLHAQIPKTLPNILNGAQRKALNEVHASSVGDLVVVALDGVAQADIIFQDCIANDWELIEFCMLHSCILPGYTGIVAGKRPFLALDRMKALEVSAIETRQNILKARDIYVEQDSGNNLSLSNAYEYMDFHLFDTPRFQGFDNAKSKILKNYGVLKERSSVVFTKKANVKRKTQAKSKTTKQKAPDTTKAAVEKKKRKPAGKPRSMKLKKAKT